VRIGVGRDARGYSALIAGEGLWIVAIGVVVDFGRLWDARLVRSLLFQWTRHRSGGLWSGRRTAALVALAQR